MIITYYIIALLLVVAYLLGSIPSAVMIGKRYYGIDIREHGSKNAGSTNVLRVLGKRAALPVFVLDFLKGFVAVSLIGIIKYDPAITEEWLINIRIVAVFAAVIGHILPIFAGFKGGKGVATLVGSITGIYPPIMVYCLGVWFITLLFTHYVSVSSMIGGICFPIFTLLSPTAQQSIPFVVFSCIVALLLIYTHRQNIERLRQGTESKIYVFRAQRLRDEAKMRKKTDNQK
ncbi:MAG: glycerol-3-phosphate 1-O-acyltransferase PlsY [Rikenellaceae bacterium]